VPATYPPAGENDIEEGDARRDVLSPQRLLEHEEEAPPGQQNQQPREERDEEDEEAEEAEPEEGEPQRPRRLRTVSVRLSCFRFGTSVWHNLSAVRQGCYNPSSGIRFLFCKGVFI
jgi:hypothetical protein